ncbi:MAG: hypothetical protein WC069_06165 [Candidatus Shapirobacteria bacterium]
MAKAKFRVDDGKWDTLLELGYDIVYPFLDRGDYASFEYVVRYEQDKRAFRPLPGMSARTFPLGIGYFVEQGPITDKGFGICEFTRTFASIPFTRTEGESVSFSITIDTVVGPAAIRNELTVLATADVRYEYFLSKPEPIYAPRVYSGNTTLPTLMIVQDSEVGIYKGRIYYRKSYFANAKNIKFISPG